VAATGSCTEGLLFLALPTTFVDLDIELWCTELLLELQLSDRVLDLFLPFVFFVFFLFSFLLSFLVWAWSAANAI
jgi:hypothetical protein